LLQPTWRSMSLFLLFVTVSDPAIFLLSLKDTLRRTEGTSSNPPPDKASEVFVESDRFSPSEGGLRASWTQQKQPFKNQYVTSFYNWWPSLQLFSPFHDLVGCLLVPLEQTLVGFCLPRQSMNRLNVKASVEVCQLASEKWREVLIGLHPIILWGLISRFTHFPFIEKFWRISFQSKPLFHAPPKLTVRFQIVHFHMLDIGLKLACN